MRIRFWRSVDRPSDTPRTLYLSAGGCLSTALQSNKHDDVGLPLGWVPHGYTGVNELAQLIEYSRLDYLALVQSGRHLVKVNDSPEGGSGGRRGRRWEARHG